MTTRKGIGYCRISKEDRRKGADGKWYVKPGISMENQEAKIRAYFGLKDIECTEIILEKPGTSAKTLKREGITRLMELIKRPDITDFVIYAQSRLCRDTEDSLKMEKLLRKNGVAYHSITETIDCSTPIGRFCFTILAGKDQLEREQTALRTADALRYNRENGRKNGGKVPYGYDEKDGMLTPNQDEQSVIRYMIAMKEKGYSLHEMCRNLEQHPTKTGKPWAPQTINGILKREGGKGR